MKCPECEYNQKVKDGMTCNKCKYEFTFNPKETENFKLTDGKFLNFIKLASQNDTVWFTKNQLYAVYCRQMKESIVQFIVPLFIGVILIVVDFYLSTGFLLIIGLFALFVGLIGGINILVTGNNKIKLEGFERCLERWKSDGKSIDHLLEKPSLHEPPPEWNEPDIYDYGVERILIVERDILVDLFVRNDVHAEQRMLVISESGYPSYLIPVARKLVEENSDLPVFLLHDATSHGTMMLERIQTSELLPLNHDSITDLGISPSNFRNLKRTKYFDVTNIERALPCDALMLPFFTRGLGAAFSEGISFTAIIEQERQKGIIYGSSDFG